MGEPTDSTDATAEGTGAEQAADASRAASAPDAPPAAPTSSGSKARSRRQSIAAPEQEPEAEPGFTWARILDPREGPAILRHEWHTIVGTFGQEIEAVKADATLAEETITRSAALKRIEEWLSEAVECDNEVPS